MVYLATHAESTRAIDIDTIYYLTIMYDYVITLSKL